MKPRASDRTSETAQLRIGPVLEVLNSGILLLGPDPISPNPDQAGALASKKRVLTKGVSLYFLLLLVSMFENAFELFETDLDEFCEAYSGSK